MKNLFIVFVMLFTFICDVNAQVYWYQTTRYARADFDSTGRYIWNKNEKSNMNICIDLEKYEVTVYGKDLLTYKIMSVYKEVFSKKKYPNICFPIEDENGCKGNVRLAVNNNEVKKIYIDFYDVTFMWDVTEIKKE